MSEEQESQLEKLCEIKPIEYFADVLPEGIKDVRVFDPLVDGLNECDFEGAREKFKSYVEITGSSYLRPAFIVEKAKQSQEGERYLAAVRWPWKVSANELRSLENANQLFYREVDRVIYSRVAKSPISGCSFQDVLDRDVLIAGRLGVVVISGGRLVGGIGYDRYARLCFDEILDTPEKPFGEGRKEDQKIFDAWCKRSLLGEDLDRFQTGHDSPLVEFTCRRYSNALEANRYRAIMGGRSYDWVGVLINS